MWKQKYYNNAITGLLVQRNESTIATDFYRGSKNPTSKQFISPGVYLSTFCSKLRWDSYLGSDLTFEWHGDFWVSGKAAENLRVSFPEAEKFQKCYTLTHTLVPILADRSPYICVHMSPLLLSFSLLLLISHACHNLHQKIQDIFTAPLFPPSRNHPPFASRTWTVGTTDTGLLKPGIYK